MSKRVVSIEAEDSAVGMSIGELQKAFALLLAVENVAETDIVRVRTRLGANRYGSTIKQITVEAS